MLGADLPASDPPAARPALQRPAELLAAGRPADAAEALAAVVAGAPTYAAAFVLLGVALDAAGRPAEALAAWHRAAFLVPNSPLVLRERKRLLDADTPAPDVEPTTAPAPDAEGTDMERTEPEDAEMSVADAPSVAEQETPETPIAEDEAPEAEAVQAETSQPVLEADGAAEVLPGPPDMDPADEAPGDDAEPDVLQTAPIDDFIFADPLTDVDDDGFDPDAFDFSAFALGDDADWLADSAPTGPPASATTTVGPSEFGFQDDATLTTDTDAPARLADWDETLDASVRLMPPETSEDDTQPDEAPNEPPQEAVFQDVPLATERTSETNAEPLDRALPDDRAPDMPPADAAWAPDPPASPASVADELDSLIASLEDAPRIRPDPTFSGPAVRTTEADVDAMASETLARIYAAQHQYVRAALVYETLAAREPERAEAMLAQAAEMRRRG